MSCLEIPKAGSGPTNFRTESSLASLPVQGLLYLLLIYIVKAKLSVYLIKHLSMNANGGVVVHFDTRCLACTLRGSTCSGQIKFVFLYQE
jgi:hypothetical protein